MLKDMTDYLISREENIRIQSKEEELKSSLLKEINKIDVKQEGAITVINFMLALLDLYNKGE